MIQRHNIRSIDIVVIGISTGGPKALLDVIPLLPGNLNVPVVIVQHMPTFFTQRLADMLDKDSALKVIEGYTGLALEKNVVYIAPGAKQMKIIRQKGIVTPVLVVTDDPPENFCKPSADYLFRSVAQIYPGRALGVIMTGMGQDGYLGLLEMKKTGSMVMAQDKESSAVFGMPMKVIEGGLADIVTPLEKIPSVIAGLVRRYPAKT